MYQQDLYKILDNHIKPKVLNRTNRYAKWEYGYNKEHDIVVISKTGKIGDIYEIQNIKIALPKEDDVIKLFIERADSRLRDEQTDGIIVIDLVFLRKCYDVRNRGYFSH